jgi:predicted dehydrogenase
VTRIGFLGAGFIARYHAHNLGLCREANEVVAVYDPAVHRREKFAAWQRCDAVDSLEAVLDASDAVFVCTWTSEHAPQVAAAASRGLAIFCEKPLAVDLATAGRMVEAVESAGVIHMVGLVLRTSPAFLALREMLADPAVGRPMSVVFRDDQYIPTQGQYRSTWRGERDKVGSGTLLEHSIHDLDIIEWLLGPVTSVSAHTSHFHELDGIEDAASVVARFAGGHTATMASVWHDVLARPSQRRVEIFCERALLTLEGDEAGPIHWQRDDSSGTLEGDALLDWLRARGVDLELAEDAFLRAVRTGGPAPAPTFVDALRAHVVADAIYRSAQSGGAAVVLDPSHPLPAG